MHRPDVDVHVASGADRRDRRPDVRRRGVARFVARRANVDREAHVAGNHVDGAGRDLQPADGADEALLAGAACLDGQHALCGRDQRVAPQGHRHRSGVSGHAGEVDDHAIGTDDGGDHADGQPFGFEHRSLLDVQFRISEHVLRRTGGVADAARVESESLERFAEPDSVGIGEVEHIRIERAGHRAAAEQRGTETDTFLVGKSDDLDCMREADPTSVQRVNALDRRHDAQHPVEPAGIAHRVEVRAKHQAWRIGGCALVPADDVADGVEARAHPGLAHPVLHQVVGRPLLF